MNPETTQKLARIVREGRATSLGTLRDGAPLVSMVLYAPADDFSAFYIHISRLAHHTQDILADARVSLMIVENDNGGDAQQLARLSIMGEATIVSPEDADYPQARDRYLAKHPAAAPLLSFGDFAFYRIVPASCRFVAGFAQAYNLKPIDLVNASTL
jgi:heme iron utilization protein